MTRTPHPPLSSANTGAVHTLYTPSRVHAIACFAEHKALYIEKECGGEINIALWNCFKSVRFLRGPGLSAPLRLPDVLQLSHSVGKFSTGRQSQWTSTCNLQPEGNRCVFWLCIAAWMQGQTLQLSAQQPQTRTKLVYSGLCDKI